MAFETITFRRDKKLENWTCSMALYVVADDVAVDIAVSCAKAKKMGWVKGCKIELLEGTGPDHGIIMLRSTTGPGATLNERGHHGLGCKVLGRNFKHHTLLKCRVPIHYPTHQSFGSYISVEISALLEPNKKAAA